ncbi:hypothetical protein M440DRAFT_360467 [Trichoderma longibrachiatum ATCC 18648]|uniref:SWR1-complex protein 4 n=1 Tax=Trichoderma longibrachiatum ATCC 18648 TaxID=983965 RepID=A0A2T4C9Z5_TRILO|nr:hypothetical protein M440DRAFT_360467 [Trichoderma longibrachiatum ATCC 18648]
MTSSDVRDVLNLPDGAAAGPRPSKKQKVAAPRPNLKGLAREVHNLGGDNPIAIVPEVTQFKKRRFVSRKPAAHWELRAFRNSGRKDGSLLLKHWRRAEDGKQRQAGEGDAATASKEEEEIEDSLYAKYNVQSNAPTTAASTSSKKAQQQQQQQQQLQQQHQAQQQQQAQQAQPQERKKLTEQEELIYGVTHHDRLGSGPTFRTEKINKLFSHKSNQQQLRITNTLNELDVPAKLAMPTAATTAAFEQLLAAVNSLLDARKVNDKIDAEIRLELAKKAELEKALGHQEADKTEDADGDAKDETAAADEASKDNGQDDGAEAQPGDGQKEEGDKAAPSDEATAKPSVEEPEDKTKNNDDADPDKEKEKDDQPESGGVTTRKRSASVLSSVSDKSTKKQKK